MTPIEELKEEVRVRRVLAVLDYLVEHGCSISEACEACNVPVRSFFRWVEQGILTDYLAECRESRRQVASVIAAEAIPDVMHYMIEIATGRKVVRGANPVAAARFVSDAMGFKEPTSAAEVGSGRPAVLALLPEMVTFRVEHGVPAVDSDGYMIIEGEAEEINEPE